ncbi:MAG: four helix bundle protein [Planctomycetes bacterium]|nr:four helix bundle protein [Planctomycetota bacterium]
MFRFEKLDVWHKAVEFADSVYSMTRKFPNDERFGLTSQMRRASVSVSSNIAEGSGRVSDKDFGRFIEISYSSVMEVVSQAQIAHRQRFLSVEDRNALNQQAEELSRMLSGLRNKLLSGS